MPLSQLDLTRFLSSVHPYDSLDPTLLDDLAPKFELIDAAPGDQIYALGEPLKGLYLVHHGEIEVSDENNMPVSILGARNSFGERGLTRGGLAVTSAAATEASVLLLLPKSDFDALMKSQPKVAKFFDRRRSDAPRGDDLATTQVDSFMARKPVTCTPNATVREAAQMMRDWRISCVCVGENRQLDGIVTTRDLTAKILAEGGSADTPLAEIMTRNPMTLSPSAIGSDVLHAMMERHIGHIPIVEGGQLVGIVTQTDLTRFQAVNSAELVSAIARAGSAEEMAKVTAEIPRLLVQLVAGGSRHEVVTRLITDIADTATRRLLALAEAKFGPPPARYLWLACGSQGRQEQTGVSDQDNCLFLDDSVTDDDMPYFRSLAKFVSDGLDTCGYFYCPGDMMATNPRWCQPLRVWKDYFRGWIAKPNPEAQMLASVMFDLRPIGGAFSLFEEVQSETLQAAASNSIFVAHMISNSLKHTPPLGLLRGFATIRSGEHRNTIDMKHNGVVPVVDLARIYALQGKLPEVNTRARLVAAEATGVLSPAGARDLMDAYDLVAETRLEHQVALIKAEMAPDNFLAPSDLSDFERSHLRDAFVVVKTMQSAVGHGKGMLG
ncbi:MAG: CBS domain-containing protein [Rhodobacteraceae bacterium]|nr:CBS domain-containing protein [Paracoccaceae bacterium]